MASIDDLKKSKGRKTSQVLFLPRRSRTEQERMKQQLHQQEESTERSEEEAIMAVLQERSREATACCACSNSGKDISTASGCKHKPEQGVKENEKEISFTSDLSEQAVKNYALVEGTQGKMVVKGSENPNPDQAASSPLVQPVRLVRSALSHTLRPVTRPGAIAIEPESTEFTTNQTESDAEIDENSSSPSSSSQEEIMAELVDDETLPEEALHEINRLRHQVTDLRNQLAHQMHQHQTIANSPIILAQAVSSSTNSQAASRQLAMPKPEPLGSSISSATSRHVTPQKQTSSATTITTRRIQSSAHKNFNLHGREKEQAILLDCLNKTKQQRQLCMISGFSGSGKTVLAESIRPKVLEQQGLFVSGKFDLYLRDQPYFAFVLACHEICDAIQSVRGSDLEAFADIQDKLRSRLSSQDIALLVAKLVPGLKEIVGYDSADDRATAGQEARNRLHYIFRLFLRTITDCFSPLVIMLDDAQWSDPSSLDLMQSILTDPDNQNLMVIGLYRSNHQGDNSTAFQNHLLTTTLNDLRQHNILAVTEVEVGNLDSTAVHSVVTELLQAKEDTTNLKGLSELCHKRTQGNAFFLISFLSMLEGEGLLEYKADLGQFLWDNETIKSQTSATSNIVDLMKQKMSKLPQEMSSVLSMAACLGSNFDRSRLEVIWSHLGSNKENSTTALQEQLTLAVAEGFLDVLDSGRTKYRFVHDKVQESAFALIPAGQTSDFKFQIGQILCQSMAHAERHDNIFLLANLLLEAPNLSLSELEQIQLAEIHLLATQEALACSAFSSAATYADKGIGCLPAMCWHDQYELSLALYSAAAEAHGVVGNYKSMQRCCDAVLKQDCPIIDKMKVYTILTLQIANSGKHMEATNMLRQVLEELGISFPKSATGRLFATVKSLIKCKNGVKSRTAEEVERLPILQDRQKVETMKMLDRLSQYCYLAGSDLAGLCLFKSIELTLKWGVSSVSSPAFAATATVLTGALNDLQAGTKIANYSLMLEEKLGTGISVSRSKMIGGNMAFSWTQPWSDVAKVLLEGYAEGMAAGDTESAMYNIYSWLTNCWFAGRTLQQMDIDADCYTKQMKELKMIQALDLTLVLWQAIRNAMGLSQDPTILQGDVIADFEDFASQHQANLAWVLITMDLEIKLCTIFGDYQKAANRFIAQGYDFPKACPGQPFFMETVFQGGLACFAMARRTGKRKYRKYALKARATVRGWVKQGNPNVRHHAAFLDAECAALKKQRHKSEGHYMRAIVLAQRGGFVQDLALVNERLSEFARTELKDEAGANYYMREAIKNYSDWGATKKVELLQEQHPSLSST